MNKQEVLSSRDLGLEFAAICGKHFLGIEHLHYGYWPDGLEVNINNMRLAQEHYTDFLISHIPAGVQTILDVGCGAGQTAKRLVDMGYKVACVSPSPVLSKCVRELLGDDGKIFECKYEMLETEDRYDLILFSESFQYVNIRIALDKTLEFLNPAGWLLICDVFRKDIVQAPDEKGVGGGKRLAKFYAGIVDFPFELTRDLDITARTAPNLDLLDDTLRNVVRPMLDSGMSFLSGRYPLMSRFLRWKYRRKIEGAYQKFFNSHRTSENFEKFKTYRLFLYRNTCAVPADARPALPADAAPVALTSSA